MKTKLLLFITIISFLFINTVQATSILKYNETITYNTTNISNIINLKTGYVTNISSTNTSLSSYNTKHEIVATKQIEGLTNSEIINYNGNIFLVGIKSNTISIYLLDSNLRILNSKDTSYIVNPSNKIKPCLYDNKIYLSITKNNILSNNNIYVIDEQLSIEEKAFSSYDNIKDILHSDYFLIKYNKEQIIYFMGETLYNNYFLIGEETKEDETIPIISMYTNDTITSINPKNKYNTYNKILVIKNKIAVLAKDENSSYLILIDKEGNITDEINLEFNNIDNMYKVGDKLFITSETDTLTSINIYNYNLNITYSSLPYGTVTIPTTSKEYDEIPISIVTNSGYEVSNIKVTDAHGNSIKLINNTFIMPDTDIQIDIEYNENIENPNTVDLITLFIIILIVSFTIGRYFYKKTVWLK